MSNGRGDPYGAFNFLVEIDGVTVAGFTEVSGLASETSIIEYRNGAEEATLRKLPGFHKYPNIVLKRGFTATDDLWKWRKAVLDGQTERRSGVITLLDEARQPVQRFVFRDGWPVRWEGPTLDSMTEAVAIETLEIAHEGLVVQD